MSQEVLLSDILDSDPSSYIVGVPSYFQRKDDGRYLLGRFEYSRRR